MLPNTNTKINKPQVTQELIDDAKRLQGMPDLVRDFVGPYSELLYTVAREEGWGNDFTDDEQIKVIGNMFDGFFLLYFTYYPENTRQQAKDSALELAKVMIKIAKDDEEFMFASLAYYWYSRKEV